MFIKFYCDNHCADFTKDEIEIIEQNQHFTNCPYCGEKLHLENLQEVVEFDIEQRIKANIDKWFKKMGIEYSIEMIYRNKEQAVFRLYEAELKKRGLIK